MTSLKDFLLRKTGNVLLFLVKENPTNLMKISKELHVNYNWVLNTIRFLEQNEIVKTKKTGRERIIYLTEKGKKVVEKLKEVINTFDETSF